MTELMKEDKKKCMTQAFAQRLRALRKAYNHTQEYLAKKLHITKSCISNWEKALRLPNTDVLMEIAEIYGVTCAYLLGSSKRPQPYVPEDKFIDKERYLDLNKLCPAHQQMILGFYEYLYKKEKGLE